MLPVSLFADGGLPDQPYIYVEGKAEIEKPADMVTLRFELVARDADQAKANQEVQGKANRILATLAEKKIGRDDVIAGDVKSEPQFEADDSSRKRGKLIGYSVTRTFAVKVRDVSAFPQIVDELIGTAGIEFGGITPGLSKQKEIQEEVWGKAVGNAREQAEKTVSPMGMKIGNVFAVSPIPFPQIREQIFRSNMPKVFARPTTTVSSEYVLAPLTVSQSVHVIYLISPAK